MAHRFFTSLLITTVAAAAWAGAVVAADEEQRDPVYVESTDIRYLESYPVQVRLGVEGAVPSPCHEPAWEVTGTESTVEVTLWSTADPDAFCAAVLEPVEFTVPLGSYESADLDVTLNGETVGRIEVGSAGGSLSEPGLAGAGWSFGMCLGYCRADLRIDGESLVQTGHDREVEEPLYTNHGQLTSEGLARLDTAAIELADTPLEDTYGCPDCADGGAAYIVLAGSDGETRHDMEFGAAPPDLSELYDLSVVLMTALETCRSNDLVTVGEECSAYQR